MKRPVMYLDGKRELNLDLWKEWNSESKPSDMHWGESDEGIYLSCLYYGILDRYDHESCLLRAKY